MRTIALSLLLAGAACSTNVLAQHRETRCGWLENDMPSEMTLTDRDGSWLVASMSYSPAGLERHMPEVNTPQACGCLDVAVDKSKKRVTQFFGGRVIQKKICANDPGLR